MQLGRFQQLGGDFQAGGVLGVQDAPFGVASLAGQLVILSLRRLVEVDSPFQQFPDGSGAFLHDRADDLFIAQPGSGVQRVRDMVLERVVMVPHGGYAALRLRGTAIQKFSLGYDRNPAVFRSSQGET